MLSFINRVFGTRLPSEEGEPAHSGRKVDEPSCPPQVYPARKRMQYNLGKNVFGYPSSGGMLQKRCSTVEVRYLGLSSNQDIPKLEDPAEEDVFCQKLRMLGAVLWPSMEHWIETLIGDERTEAEQVELEVGWPKDGRGVWVWRCENKRERQVRLKELEKARSMDERCHVIEDMGGRFYANPGECPELATAFMDQDQR